MTGVFLTGVAGNTRIQTFPPRRTYRVMTRRAASIWRLSSHTGSMACKPNSPKTTVVPRCAVPRFRPRCCFRCLTRDGINIALLPLRFYRRRWRGQWLGLVPGQHVSLVDPNLHADHPVGRDGLGRAVID